MFEFRCLVLFLHHSLKHVALLIEHVEWHSWHFICSLAWGKRSCYYCVATLLWKLTFNYQWFLDQKSRSSFELKWSDFSSRLLSRCCFNVFFLNLCVSLQCQGVSGIIIITMVTSFMLVYNSSSGDRSSLPSPLSSPSSHRFDGSASAAKKPEWPQKLPASKLEGYTGVMDHKVNIQCETICLLMYFHRKQWCCNWSFLWNI